MEYLFLFAIVTPLALLILNLSGFMAGKPPVTATGFDAVVPAAPVFTPAAPVTAEPLAAKTSDSTGVAATLAGALTRTKRHRRDYFGDFRPMDSVLTLDALETADSGAEIYLMPRRDVAPATVLSGPPAAHARPGGNLVSFPSHTPLVAQRSVAQR